MPPGFVLDNLVWINVDLKYKNDFILYHAYNPDGYLLYSLRIYRHANSDYLKVYLMDQYLSGGSHPGTRRQRKPYIPALSYTNNENEMLLSGYMPYIDRSQSPWDTNPGKSSLIIYIQQDGYGIENNTDYDRITSATPAEELTLFKRVLSVCKGEIPVQYDPEEGERLQKLWQQHQINRWLELEKNFPEYAKKEWDRIAQEEPRQFTRIFWDNANYGKGIEKLLKLEPLPERNTIPNINTGVGCEPFLAELIQKGFQLTARKGGNYLMTATLKDKKTSIRYCIYHAFNPVDTRQTLFAWNMYADERGTPRIVEKPGDFTMQAALDNMNVRPGWVGDFDICTKPRFNWEGSLIEGSEKSAVYFMRGNTAAYFIADNPSYDVRPLARMLDIQLKKGMKPSPHPSDKTEEKTDRLPSPCGLVQSSSCISVQKATF